MIQPTVVLASVTETDAGCGMLLIFAVDRLAGWLDRAERRAPSGGCYLVQR
jgi:hypothetical protein